MNSSWGLSRWPVILLHPPWAISFASFVTCPSFHFLNVDMSQASVSCLFPSSCLIFSPDKMDYFMILTVTLLFSRQVVSNSLRPHGHLFFFVPLSSCLQSFPASRFFPMSQLFISGGQSIGASASASLLLMNIQGWFPLRLISLILQSKGLSRIFSSTTVQRHHFLCAQPSLWSNSHIHTWLLEKP